MKLTVYNDLVKELQFKETRASIQQLSGKYGAQYNTVLAIYSQSIQKRMKKLSFIHADYEVQDEHFKNYIADRDSSNTRIFDLAERVGIPPVMMAKIILEHLDMPYERGVPVNQLLKEPTLIAQSPLQEQVTLCLEQDTLYGPNIDVIKKSIGDEYEEILKDSLRFQKIPFKDENVLRTQGYDKTPDILLTVPVAVQGKIVNWVESKASFGDEFTHKNYLREQYWSYWNRFGSGLVIYWFGFVEELSAQTEEKGIVISDCLPNNIITLL